MKQSICYISNDFSKVDTKDLGILSPEGLLNEKQISEWINDLKENPKIFATTSLYLLRELDLSDVYILYRNIIDGEIIESYNIDDVGDLEILDRELHQSDRYLNRKFDDPVSL